LGVSYLFIGHDLATVAHISDRIAVMYLGQIVELADSLELCAKPLHPYTQALFTAALPSHRDQRREKLQITGEVPSALDPPSGCRFHPRCPHAMPHCAREQPTRKEVGPRHTVACHLYSKSVFLQLASKGIQRVTICVTGLRLEGLPLQSR
jgi:oligopeptide transport system ATP-binding protein